MSAAFEFTGGALCLDFANTKDYRKARDSNQEKLHSFTDLLEWSRQAGAVTDSVARRLSQHAGREPHQAVALLRRAKQLRDALYQLFTNLRRPGRLDILNLELRRSGECVQLQELRQGVEWVWAGKPDALDRLLWPIVRSAVDLLQSESRRRVRVCESDTCGWLFIDASKNRSRRWCDMKVCGNRAKARRFYKRHRRA